MPVLRQRLLRGASGAALPLLVAACMDQPLASDRPSASAPAGLGKRAEPGAPPGLHSSGAIGCAAESTPGAGSTFTLTLPAA